MIFGAVLCPRGTFLSRFLLWIFTAELSVHTFSGSKTVFAKREREYLLTFSSELAPVRVAGLTFG